LLFLKSLPVNEPLYWIGLGSNLLIRDGGIRGTVIYTRGRLNEMRLMEGGQLYVEAGVSCARVARFCAENGLMGAEFLAGIPGTMGGALAMNAGAFDGETWAQVESVELTNNQGDLVCRQRDEFEVGYRQVNRAENEWFLSAIMNFPAGDGEESRVRVKALLAHRAATQPTNQPSCGSVFRNPEGDYAARLIESCGLKGQTIGGAVVSEKHANFIINAGNAKAAELEALINLVKERVEKEQGVQLHAEVCIVGEPLESQKKSGRTIQNPKDFGRVAVLMGGTAAERAVSLKSGQAVYEALLRNGVDAVALDVSGSPVDAIVNGNYSRIFNMLHGRGGEDGVMQGVLQALSLPFTGSDVLGSALSMDKLRSKLCWLGCELPTPAWMQLEGVSDLPRCEEKLGYPVIVKPAQEGSSIGMSCASNFKELIAAWELASQCGCDVFAEQWITGKEYTVALVGEVGLPTIRLETANQFYDYEAKYLSNSTQYHCPCGLSEVEEKALQQLAMKAAKALSVSGWGRVDLMVDEQGQPWLIEVNTIPGMTDHSLVPMAANAAGISFDELVWLVLETSFKGQEANFD
jgi:D-alanine-D-alanine ligase